MLKSTQSYTPTEGSEDAMRKNGQSMKDMTPELSEERGFYQQDINHVCNALPVLPLYQLKGTGRELGAPYQMLQN